MGLFQRLFGTRGTQFASFASLKSDMHSHVIPGIDDGASSLDDSLDMLRAMSELGFQKVITTPHVMRDGFPNTPEGIKAGLERVRREAQEHAISIELEAAAEYYLDEAFLTSIESGLLFFGGQPKFVLFETSYVSKPMSLNNAVFKMQTHGYTPVLAHPERYQYWWGKSDALEEMEELRNRGVKFQVNISSFAGRHGKASQVLAKQLVKSGMVDFLGTDMHKARQAETMKEALKGSKDLRALLDSGNLLNQHL
jgi:tyrosine-protein phosphatase YwqE